MARVRGRLQEGIGAAYVLGAMLGRGGMGIVFQAREVALDRDVALKVLAFDPVLNPEAYERFEREAKLAARLDHPNIVPIFAVGQGNGIAFYTMRMVRGGSVEGLMAAGQPLAVERALAILTDVAAALDYAHSQGVVHRDIKPANVLLGESGHAMVADFGIARAFSGPAASGTTGTGTGVIGSPAYMSPEQWRGEKVDGRADQYALGVLAFELLAGQRPFAGDSMQELLRMHLQDDAPDILSFRGDLPSHHTDAIRRALAKDPADRFPNAGAFVAALGSAPSRGASRFAAATIAPSSAPTVRNPLPRGTSSQPGAAQSAAGGAGAVSSAPAGESKRPEPKTRRSLVPWLALLLVAVAGAAVIWKLSPSRGAGGTTASSPAGGQGGAPAGAAAVNLDSIANVERSLQAEIAAARKLAMDAERRADSIAAASRAAGAPAGGTSRPADDHAHLYVFAEGGTPQVVLDGTPQRGATPLLLQVSPGDHRVAVRGAVAFAPAETTITLAAEDTETVIFRANRGGLQRRRAGDPAADNPVVPAPPGEAVPGRFSEYFTRDPATGKVGPNWPIVTQKLGFDPRTTDPRSLTPQQRLAYRRFQQFLDSAKRIPRP